MKQAMIGLLVIVVVGGVIYFVSSPTSSVISPPAEAPSAMTDVNVRVIDMEAGSFYYKPSVIEVAKGQKIKIIMKSVSLMHDFVIDELGVKLPIVKNGDMGTVEFVADKVGTFEYYCSVGLGKHRANGQVGTITVK